MPTTWLEWKCKASLLDNQWRRFQNIQPKAPPNWPFSPPPPPAIVSTPTASSSSSRPSASTASSVPQPMDLDRTHPVKRDPRHGLCFNCGKPGHIMKVCRGPCTQNIWNVDAMMIPRLTPKDLQFLTESLRVTVTQVLGSESRNHHSINVPDVLGAWSSADLHDVAWFAKVEAETMMRVSLHQMGVIQVHRLGD